MLGEYSYAFLASLAGVAYPLFHSFRALKADEAPDWLPYWLVFVLFSTLAYPLDLIFSSWVPLWYELKLGFIVALQPETLNLAKVLYDKQLEPALIQLDQKLANDETVAALQIGWEKFKKMPLQQKWTCLKEVDLTGAVQSAQALIGMAPMKKAVTPPAAPEQTETPAEGVVEGLPPAPPVPPAPASSDEAEMVDAPEDAPEPLAKKTQ